MKKVIINADDFGYSVKTNEAIKLGADVINAASLLANLSGFEHAVKEIIPQIPSLNLGFHFNIMEGKSLTNIPLLTDFTGCFNQSWQKIMLNSYSKKFQRQVEGEFRAQLEKILNYTPVFHIDSHVHTHAIPFIFDISVKLANEYKIPYIRTQKEIPYITQKIYPFNCLKNFILNTFTQINRIKHPDIKTNDYLIGVLYTGVMSQKTILSGLEKIKKENSLTEIIIHPSLETYLNRKREFEITQDKDFVSNLNKAGFSLL